MRYVFLLALILPYAIALGPHPQDDELQDIDSEDWRQDSTSDALIKGRRDSRAGMASHGMTGRKERETALAAFPQLRNTDCHSGVAARMGDTCGVKSSKEDSTVMSEGERSDIAISLTICSMTSALQPIPTECHLWTDTAGGTRPKEGGRRWLWVGLQRGGNVRTSRAICLSALHRSPQDWTAYNNYLSDALQLCHALRSQHAEDTAQELLRNTTQSQIDFLHVVQETAESREMRDVRQAELTTSQLLKSEQAAAHIGQLVERLQQGSDDANKVIQQVQSALDDFEASSTEVWRDVQGEAMRRSEVIFERMAAGLEDVRGAFAQELATQFGNLALQHGEIMRSQSARVYEELGLSLASAQSGVELLVMQIADRLRDNDLALQGWENTMSVARSNLAGLASNVHDLRPIMRESADSALIIQRAHYSLAQSMKDTDAISESIVRNLAMALSDINSTMTDIRRPLQPSTLSWQWFQPGFSLFSSPALLTSPTLSNFISPDSLQAMVYTANFSLGWMVKIVLWIVSELAASIVSILAVLVIAASGLLAGQSKRIRQAFKHFTGGDVDVEGASPKNELPRTPLQRLDSLAPPAYTSPERRSPRPYQSRPAVALGVDFGMASQDAKERWDDLPIREAMLRRSYGHLQQAERRARRSVSAPL